MPLLEHGLRDRFAGADGRALLLQSTWGLEKESQRIGPDGRLALTPHPAAFGDKLTHPYITTDFAESQLELITPPLAGTMDALECLAAIHDEVYAGLGGELLWPLSMPPVLPPEEDIPIARYGPSPEGRAREAYREGLAARYGKRMQMICGLHVNFSYGPDLVAWYGERRFPGLLPEERRDALYFAAARNFLRYRWLLIYLFGASPAFDPSYGPVVSRELAEIEARCPACSGAAAWHARFATSLRVSRYGYVNAFRTAATVSFNGRAEYVKTFRRLLETELATESEWYSPIRLKSFAAKGESQLAAMERCGVKYMEVRLLDLDPWERTGVSLARLDVLHLFLLFCLLADSPPIDEAECRTLQENHHLVSLFGRKPGLKLLAPDGREMGLAEWAETILDGMAEIADWADDGSGRYVRAVERERAKVRDASRVPSAVMMREMDERGESFAEYGLRLARMHGKIPLAEGSS